MALTVLALYEDRKTGLLAARDLLDHGFSIDDINILSGGEATLNWATLDPTEPQKDNIVKGAGIGAAVGAVGGIIASLVAFTVPGVGPVLAAGPILAGLLGGGSVGAMAGALIGGLADIGVPQHHAEALLEGVRKGGTLVALQTDDEERARTAAHVLNRRNPMDMMRSKDDDSSTHEQQTASADESEIDGGVLIVRSVTIRLPDSTGLGEQSGLH